jgi:hypothetical protein
MKENLQVQEVKTYKQNLELEIARLIDEFHDYTGTRIDCINYKIYDMTTLGDIRNKFKTVISIDVKI